MRSMMAAGLGAMLLLLLGTDASSWTTDIKASIKQCQDDGARIKVAARHRGGMDQLSVQCKGRAAAHAALKRKITIDAAQANVTASVAADPSAWTSKKSTDNVVGSIAIVGPDDTRPSFSLGQDLVMLKHLDKLTITNVHLDELSSNTINFSSLTTLVCINATVARFILPVPNQLHTISLYNNSLPSFPVQLLHLREATLIELRGNAFANPVALTPKQLKQLQKLAKRQVLRLDHRPPGTTTSPSCTCPASTTPTMPIADSALCVCLRSSSTSVPSPTNLPMTTAASVPTTPSTFDVQTPSSPINLAPSPSSSKDSTVLIVSIAAGVLAVILLVMVFVYRRHRRNRRCYLPQGLGQPLATHGSHPPSSSGGRSSMDVTETRRRTSLAHTTTTGAFRIPPDEFEYPPRRLAGSRHYWTSTLLDHKVAMRCSHDIHEADQLQGFVDALKFVAQLHHPSLVAFQGVYFHPTDGEFCAVVEYMDKGGLGNVLLSPRVVLDMAQKRLLAKQVVHAVAYVVDTCDCPANPSCCTNLVVQTKSFLVNAALECKLNIFQLALSACRAPPSNAVGAHLLKWLAPECITETVECLPLQDRETIHVYGLGLVLGEIFTRRLCFAALVHAKGHVGGDLYLRLHSTNLSETDPFLHAFDWRAAAADMDATTLALIRSACARNPAARPSLNAIFTHFSNLDYLTAVQASSAFQTSNGLTQEELEEINDEVEVEVVDSDADFRSFHAGSSVTRDRLVQSFRASMIITSPTAANVMMASFHCGTTAPTARPLPPPPRSIHEADF
ncbi:Aste57867_8113 [Aphanomyces stellatus]|uniref:Aste57867_8113 protein n=1 Tax=Aphanomyces stellatus TaxID=120398 RepID=A0A485KJD5_9STRA|nr:hypothetical protein As57867_008083 [Aphanomyces stellatus]VFT85002.1 Aste57867_8113 [Aphanomyces stellatus]